MTRTAYTLDDVGGRLSWSALSSFVRHLDTGSELAKDLGKSTGWESTVKTNALLADIYDLLQAINANICNLRDRKRRKIKPYPRPGKEKDTKKIGKGAMPFNALAEWFEEKRNAKRRKH